MNCVRLKANAVPSVFNAFPSHLKTEKTKQKGLKPRASTSAQHDSPTASELLEQPSTQPSELPPPQPVPL